MASLAAGLGVPVEEIKRIGNWKSNALLRYARRSDEQLRQGAAELS